MRTRKLTLRRVQLRNRSLHGGHQSALLTLRGGCFVICAASKRLKLAFKLSSMRERLTAALQLNHKCMMGVSHLQ
jgi:hypothetical protein